jgi:hypothetical protein
MKKEKEFETFFIPVFYFNVDSSSKIYKALIVLFLGGQL